MIILISLDSEKYVFHISLSNKYLQEQRLVMQRKMHSSYRYYIGLCQNGSGIYSHLLQISFSSHKINHHKERTIKYFIIIVFITIISFSWCLFIKKKINLRIIINFSTRIFEFMLVLCCFIYPKVIINQRVNSVISPYRLGLSLIMFKRCDCWLS